MTTLATIGDVLGTAWWSVIMLVVGFAAAKIGIVDWAISLLPWKRDK
jgi:hypothetical protein